MEHDLFVGVDVASRKLDARFVDGTGSAVRGDLCVPNSPEGFAALWDAICGVDKNHVVLGCESTSAYHKPLLASMSEHVDVVELNPLVIKRFTELQLRGSRSDRTDANSIAQYLRTFRPRATVVEERNRRDMTIAVRLRRKRVQDRTRLKNSFKRYLGEILPGLHTSFRKLPKWLIALVAAHPCPAELTALSPKELASIRTAGGATVSLRKLQTLQQFLGENHEPWSPLLQVSVGELARGIMAADRAVMEFDRLLEEACEGLEEFDLLKTIDGVGSLTAATVLAEVGDIRNFPTVSHFIGYCGLYPASKKSGDAAVVFKMVRKGNRALRLQILLASTTARTQNRQVAALYRRLRAGGKSASCAGGAAGRKLATQIYAVLTTGRPYDPEKP